MRLASLLLAAVVATGAGCGSGGDERASSPAEPLGKVRAGSVVQFADCGDWQGGSRAERFATVAALRGQLTPQRSKTAASPLPDDRAYELFQKTCASSAESLRLYKMYVRMQGFAPLSQ